MNPETRDAIKFAGTVFIGFSVFTIVGIYFPPKATWTVYCLGLLVLFFPFFQSEELPAYGLLAILWLIAITWVV